MIYKCGLLSITLFDHVNSYKMLQLCIIEYFVMIIDVASDVSWCENRL